MDISIVIPAYNEAKRIEPTLQDIYSILQSSGLTHEIMVVNDGSTDNTNELIQNLQQNIPTLRLETLNQNEGKGSALRHGVLAARGDVIITADADGSTPFSEYAKLYAQYQNDPTGIAIGSRHLPMSNVVIKQPWYRILISRIANVIIQLLLVPGVKDTQCGFKLFPREIGQDLYARSTINGFGIDMEILYLARRKNNPIYEIPVTWLNSKESTLRPIRGTWNTFKELLTILKRHN